MAYKLNSTINRSYAVIQNSQNALSYLQVQDAALATTGNILDRMAELRTMAQDITKNSGDIENYSKESSSSFKVNSVKSVTKSSMVSAYLRFRTPDLPPSTEPRPVSCLWEQEPTRIPQVTRDYLRQVRKRIEDPSIWIFSQWQYLTECG